MQVKKGETFLCYTFTHLKHYYIFLGKYFLVNSKEPDESEATLKLMAFGMPLIMFAMFPGAICLIHFELHAAAAIKQAIVYFVGWENYIQVLILVSSGMVMITFTELIILYQIVLCVAVFNTCSSVLDKCK